MSGSSAAEHSHPLLPQVEPVLYPLDSAHGLRSNQVQCLAQDQQARLWMATPAGLACYDGGFVHVRDRYTGLRCTGLRTVAIDPKNRVWIGSDAGIDLLDSTGRLDEVMHDWSFGLCENIGFVDDDIWLATSDGVIKLELMEGARSFRLGYIATVGFINDLICLSKNSVYAATSQFGLIKTNGHSWWQVRVDGSVGLDVQCLAQRGDNLVLGTSDGALVVNDSGASVACLTIDGWTTGVTALTVEADRIWVGFRDHLAAFDAADESYRVTERHSVDSAINDLLADDLGNVWIATDHSGLAAVSCLRHAVSRVDVKNSSAVFSIRRCSESRFLVAGEARLARLDLNESTKATSPATTGLPSTTVWDAVESNRTIWASTQHGLFRAGPDFEFSQVFADDPQIGGPCRALALRADEMFVGSLRGLSRISGDHVQAVEVDGKSLGYVYALSVDRAGRLWLGTRGRGLWREHDGELQPLGDAPLTTNGNTYAIEHAPDGRTIVLQDEHIILVEPAGTLRQIARDPPLAGWCVQWIDEQNIAVGSSSGLKTINLHTGQTTRHVRSIFRRREWEFTNQRSLLKDDQGRFLCGLGSGLARVDLTQLATYPPPECKLVDIQWRGIQAEDVHGAYRVRTGNWTVRVRAYAAWFVDSPTLTYQFQLAGFDDHWSARRTDPTTTFNSLPPGSYRLLARARSPLVGQGPVCELMRLVVERPGWGSSWTTVVSAMNRMYDRLVRQRIHEQERERQTRELEEAVADRTSALRAANEELLQLRDTYQRLSEVDDLTQISNRRGFQKELARAIALANRLKTPVALLMIDVDYFKPVNDRYGHQVGDDYLKLIAARLDSTIRLGEDHVSRYGGEEFAAILVDSDRDACILAADRLREAIEGMRLPNERAPAGIVTISIGAAIRLPDSQINAEDLIRNADEALYQAKREGRNRSVLYRS